MWKGALQKQYAYLYFFGGAILLIGIVIGRITKEPIVIKPQVLRETNSGYNFINPVLLCNTDNLQAYNEDKELTSQLNAYVKKYSNTDISVYYLNLTTGMWASVNDKLTFSPASMLKVPTMVDTLKYAESHPDILSKKLYYDGSFENNKAEYYKPQKSIEPGKYYSIDELLSYVILYSDNNAVALIHTAISTASLEELYKDLHIDIPPNTLDFMSARTYALFLRVLYNSTYLNRDMSEKALSLMSQAEFPVGIEGGIPQNIAVAQKFGERQVFDTTGNSLAKELHDCGIVYAGRTPYIICIMTRGGNFEDLSKHIQDLSKITYNHVIAQ